MALMDVCVTSGGRLGTLLSNAALVAVTAAAEAGLVAAGWSPARPCYEQRYTAAVRKRM